MPKLADIGPDAPVRRVWAVTRPAGSRSAAAEAMLEESRRFAEAR